MEKFIAGQSRSVKAHSAKLGCKSQDKLVKIRGPPSPSPRPSPLGRGSTQSAGEWLFRHQSSVRSNEPEWPNISPSPQGRGSGGGGREAAVAARRPTTVSWRLSRLALIL